METEFNASIEDIHYYKLSNLFFAKLKNNFF